MPKISLQKIFISGTILSFIFNSNNGYNTGYNNKFLLAAEKKPITERILIKKHGVYNNVNDKLHIVKSDKANVYGNTYRNTDHINDNNNANNNNRINNNVNNDAGFDKIHNKIKFKEPLPVLLYHHITINDEKSERYKLPMGELERQFNYIKQQNYDTIFLSDLDDSLIYNKEKIIILTFDDTDKEFYTYVFPIIKKYNIKVTIFPIVSTIKNKNNKKWLCWDELKEMERSGLIDVQSHTMSHPKLTKLSQKEVVYELAYSKFLLEKNLNKKIKHLAWPYGDYNRNLISLALELGYDGFLTCDGEKNSELVKTRIKRIEIDGRWRIETDGKFRHIISQRRRRIKK